MLRIMKSLLNCRKGQQQVTVHGRKIKCKVWRQRRVNELNTLMKSSQGLISRLSKMVTNRTLSHVLPLLSASAFILHVKSCLKRKQRKKNIYGAIKMNPDSVQYCNLLLIILIQVNSRCYPLSYIAYSNEDIRMNKMLSQKLKSL